MAFFLGPRHTTDSRDDERRKPIDMHARRPPVRVSRDDEEDEDGAEGGGGAVEEEGREVEEGVPLEESCC